MSRHCGIYLGRKLIELVGRQTQQKELAGNQIKTDNT